MSEQTVAERVREIVLEMAAERPTNAALADDLSLREDLHYDSLSLVSLMFRLQEEFALEMGDVRRTMRRATTLDRLIESTQQLLVERAVTTSGAAS